jgi:hypothetical protein
VSVRKAVMGKLSKQMFGVMELKQGREVSLYTPYTFCVTIDTSHDLIFMCMLSGFQCSVNVISALLECYAA